MVRVRIVGALLPILLCLAIPCAADERQERRVRCGNYSYVLPQGFTARDTAQPYSRTISLSTREDKFSVGECSVICIRRQRTGDRQYLIGRMPLIAESSQIKNGLVSDPVEYVGALPPGIRLYYDEYPKNKSVDHLDWEKP